MNKDAQRIAIAEACGFRKIHEVFSDWELKTKWNSPHRYFRPPESDYGDELFPNQAWGWGTPSEWNLGVPDWEGVPDYLRDLNAMYEAEKILGHTASYRGGVSQQVSYALHIEAVLVPPDRFGDCGRAATFWIAHATAAQRAEAFLHTIGKWVDQ